MTPAIPPIGSILNAIRYQRDFAIRHGFGLSILNKWLRSESDVMLAWVKFEEVPLDSPTARWPVEIVGPQNWIVRLQTDSEVYFVEARIFLRLLHWIFALKSRE